MILMSKNVIIQNMYDKPLTRIRWLYFSLSLGGMPSQGMASDGAEPRSDWDGDDWGTIAKIATMPHCHTVAIGSHTRREEEGIV